MSLCGENIDSGETNTFLSIILFKIALLRSALFNSPLQSLSKAPSNLKYSSRESGTHNSAAAEGVGALISETKSHMVKSVSWPTADIIGTDSGDMFTSLIIDKGSNNGISAKDPVVYGNYLVGVVKKAHPTYSVVETFLNPGVNISALESKTREVSYVTTTVEYMKSGLCIMESLDRTTAIAPGGLVITSGIGGLYPKGLIIGSVKEIGESKFELSSYAVIEPGADLSELESVVVITAFEGQGIEEIVD